MKNGYLLIRVFFFVVVILMNKCVGSVNLVISVFRFLEDVELNILK